MLSEFGLSDVVCGSGVFAERSWEFVRPFSFQSRVMWSSLEDESVGSGSGGFYPTESPMKIGMGLWSCGLDGSWLESLVGGV